MRELSEPLAGSSINSSPAMDSGEPAVHGSFVPLIGYAEHLQPGNYHWRARIAANHPLFPRSIWFTLPDSSSTEQKFRVPEPASTDTPTSETPLRIR
jgi:hypothetical protein